jgi:hypothetical protein
MHTLRQMTWARRLSWTARAATAVQLAAILTLIPVAHVAVGTPGTPGQGEVFGSDYWADKIRRFPQCAGVVNQHKILIGQIQVLDGQARKSVEPRRGQLVDHPAPPSRQPVPRPSEAVEPAETPPAPRERSSP